MPSNTPHTLWNTRCISPAKQQKSKKKGASIACAFFYSEPHEPPHKTRSLAQTALSRTGLCRITPCTSPRDMVGCFIHPTPNHPPYHHTDQCRNKVVHLTLNRSP